MSTHYLKHYPDQAARLRALGNYVWLAGMKPHVRLPRLMPISEREHLRFEYVEGRHALPEDLRALAAYLGGMHGAAFDRELHRARLRRPYTTGAGHTLPDFPGRRMDAVVRELRAGRVLGTRLTAHEAQRLITSAVGPATFYKDANPRNFIVTPVGDPVTIDFDDLTLAPFGYDLAKLVVTLAMTHGHIPAADIAAALGAYNTAAARHRQALPSVTWEELMSWAEIHHILTTRYAADGRYRYRWDQTRPAEYLPGDRAWP
jgi:Ser/Thr protein kinase RdoA (MazF antagonist)